METITLRLVVAELADERPNNRKSSKNSASWRYRTFVITHVHVTHRFYKVLPKLNVGRADDIGSGVGVFDANGFVTATLERKSSFPQDNNCLSSRDAHSASSVLDLGDLGPRSSFLPCADDTGANADGSRVGLAGFWLVAGVLGRCLRVLTSSDIVWTALRPSLPLRVLLAPVTTS